MLGYFFDNTLHLCYNKTLQHIGGHMPFWMQTEDPDYQDDQSWQDLEDLDEDELNDANRQLDNLPG